MATDTRQYLTVSGEIASGQSRMNKFLRRVNALQGSFASYRVESVANPPSFVYPAAFFCA